ncbi:hypothetical protein EV649_3260 [Kribbella sp. VKM Ac-2569]|jgi:hypothetical protein|uniref:hypothetical protein n=1 Tax=Kribbella sp. VKM Ac-2569 TaxID=2512220 RepID=UPI00102C06F5|nr:hypothetical protein [Kribbella sp. VKM Ac-2569]RZT20118.1 hypothetical protein EV649_3260 [Kribbella sp. VKM Ac-2569]
MTVAKVSGWVWSANLRTALKHISWSVGYAFDDWDWEAMETALPQTSWDPPEHWYDYPIIGDQTLTVHLAHNSGDDPVGIRVEGDLDEILAARIETIIDLLSDITVAEE